MVFNKQKRFSPFYVRSIYIDTQDYLADTIINDVCLPITILDEHFMKTEGGKTYVIVYVKYHKKYSERFKRFLDILRYNMLMYNNAGYLDDCKELMESIKDDEIFGGNWS